MGHMIGYDIIDAKSPEEAVKKGMAFAQEFADYYVDEEEDPTCSYHGNFKFYNKICVNEEEAQDFFNSLGPYRDGIVKIKMVSGSVLNKFNEQIKKQKIKQVKIKADCTEAFMARKSRTIGCKECGKRFNNNEINKCQLCCPNCGN